MNVKNIYIFVRLYTFIHCGSQAPNRRKCCHGFSIAYYTDVIERSVYVDVPISGLAAEFVMLFFLKGAVDPLPT